MEITTYAPVFIPTLNRYEHFKRCLESLERCTGADKTEIYVGLDYPPTDSEGNLVSKYVDGWKKIDAYLHEKEKQNGFKALKVYRRDHNVGCWGKVSNYTLLRDEIERTYDRYIGTEDDNEFSPCFLEYMNKSLERFKDDPRINLVCGYDHVRNFPDSYVNNFYIHKYGCPWGTGHWVSKEKEIENYFDLQKLRETLRGESTFKVIKQRMPELIPPTLNMLKQNKLWGDTIRGIYSALYDTYCVLPRLSMVRNHGNDGTGEHSTRVVNSQNDFFSNQSISSETTFDFTNDIFTFRPLYMETTVCRPPFSVYRWLVAKHASMRTKLDLFLLQRFDYLPKSRWI